MYNFTVFATYIGGFAQAGVFGSQMQTQLILTNWSYNFNGTLKPVNTGTWQFGTCTNNVLTVYNCSFSSSLVLGPNASYVGIFGSLSGPSAFSNSQINVTIVSIGTGLTVIGAIGQLDTCSFSITNTSIQQQMQGDQAQSCTKCGFIGQAHNASAVI